MKWRYVFVVVVMAMSAGGQAQKLTVSEQDKADAVREGVKLKGKLAGLHLADSAQVFAAGMNANNANKAGTNTGFSLRVYTPITWVMQTASEAAKEYRPFTVADIADEMVEPVLRVSVYPDTPTYLTASGMAGTSSVQHVILRSADKKTVIQPIWKEPFEEGVSNAMGGKGSYQGLNAKFDLASLREIRGPGGQGEFQIVVIGTATKEKAFTVKAKHFERLP